MNFQRSSARRLLDMVQVNCSAVVHLTRLFLPQMMQRRSGDVLIVASTASFQAVPYISTYAATKAFDLLLAEGLAEEMKPYGIRVCALCPGSTESEFREVANQTSAPAPTSNREPAGQGCQRRLGGSGGGQELRDLRRRKTTWAPRSQRLVPRRIVTRISAKLFRPPATPNR